VGRYDRQTVFEQLGPAGQRRLGQSRALIGGPGGPGCTVAELLARGGVGALRLLDDDTVKLVNLHRQILYDESDAASGAQKVTAAAARLTRINREVRLEPVAGRFGPDNAQALAGDVDVIIDGTDNFATRFVINDLAVRDGLPWVFAGALGAQCQTMTIVPGRTPCLRCVFESPPPPSAAPTCRTAGVIAPAVLAVAAVQAAEAMKILAGHGESISPFLLKFDFWANTVQRIEVARACGDVDCPCCKGRDFEFLRPDRAAQ
jgi:adenylyltransferase/sulfurtransferase